MINQPMINQPDRAAIDLDDPVAFAHRLYAALGRDGDPRIINPPHDVYARYEAAVRAAGALHHSDPAELPAEHPIERADEAAHSWATESHAAGVEFGVAAEQLRRSLLAGGDGPRLPWNTPPPVRKGAATG